MEMITRWRVIIAVSLLYLAENEVHIQFNYQFHGPMLLPLTDNFNYSANNLLYKSGQKN